MLDWDVEVIPMPLYEPKCKLPAEVQVEVDRKAEERVHLQKAYSTKRTNDAGRLWHPLNRQSAVMHFLLSDISSVV